MKTKICFILIVAIVIAGIGISDAITVQMNYGNPVITSVNYSSIWNSGGIPVTVYITNSGGDDYIQIGVEQNIGTVNYGNNRKWIPSGKSDFLTFTLYPTVVTAQMSSINITALAPGSGIQSQYTMNILLNPTVTPTKQSSGFDIILSIISITALLILRLSK